MLNIIEKLMKEDLLKNNKDFLYSLLEDSKLEFISKNMPSFFKYGKQIDTTAYLSWNFNFSYTEENDFDIMANAYYECTMELIDRCLEDNLDKKLDTWIFPILYNISHSIELKLKVIYVYQRGKLKLSKANHKWLKLIESIKEFYIKENDEKNVSQYKMKMNNQFIISLEIVEEFLKKFLSQTDDITFMRYPIDKNSNEFFYNNSEENVVIDLILLRNEFILSYYLLNFIVEMNCEEKSNT